MNRLLTVILSLVFSVTMMAENKRFVLVIDAGHGGHDSGAIGAFSKEKDINLNTALAFGRLVEANCSDVKVIYTRKRDVFIPLHERADIANKNHADVFISIHTNSLPPGHQARGLETYTMGMRRSDEKLSAAQRENSVITIEKDYKEHYEGYDPNSPESAIMFEFMHDRNMSKSVELAKYVQKEVCASANRPNKGVKQDVFLVLRETSMPACLIELGFISTPDEESLLNDKAAIDRFAQGIYNAFVKYKNKNDHSGKSYGVIANDNNAVMGTKAKETVNPARPVASNVARQPKAEPAKSVKAEPVTPVKAEPVTRVKAEPVTPVMAEPSTPSVKPESVPHVAAVESSEPVMPVFKVQFLTNNKVLRPDSNQLKGVTGASYYRDGNTVKYTIGECSTFNDAYKLQKTIADMFPDAFVVAFLNGERIDINVARKIEKESRE